MCIIAVDFDKTITADYDKARAALSFLMDQGHEVIIWSSRNSVQHWESKSHQLQMFNEMLDLLSQHQIPYDLVDDGSNGKIYAHVYIDDKCWRFENNWDEIVSRIY